MEMILYQNAYCCLVVFEVLSLEVNDDSLEVIV